MALAKIGRATLGMLDSLLSGDHVLGNGVALQRLAPRYVIAALLQLTLLWSQSPAQQAREHASGSSADVVV